ncbi:hypothetical protein CDL12_26427 [Handroanthus impetiginosus]|uniref:Secreted protein n=1 Tax=Handroanthus impetiginosus TaxID=429701 RepID=A0A2G9G6Z1_9LAMI|nr:hypothetical protein CDL12_26427 [Handroanthus impetiginosus]
MLLYVRLLCALFSRTIPQCLQIEFAQIVHIKSMRQQHDYFEDLEHYTCNHKHARKNEEKRFLDQPLCRVVQTDKN